MQTVMMKVVSNQVTLMQFIDFFLQHSSIYSFSSIYGELVATPPIRSLLLLLPSFHILKEFITTPIFQNTQGACFYSSYPSIYSEELVTTPPILPYTQGACYYFSYPSIYLEELVIILLLSLNLLRELVTTPSILPYTQENLLLLLPSSHTLLLYFSFFLN